MDKNQFRGLRSKVVIAEEDWTINLKCGHIITEKELRENTHCPICNTKFTIKDNCKIILNAIERLKERLNK